MGSHIIQTAVPPYSKQAQKLEVAIRRHYQLGTIMLLHAIIVGRVQGVGFRYWVLSQAQKISVTGWVRNLRDGRVELEAEGTEDQLFELEQILWKGPALSRVDSVDVTYSQTTKNYERFQITH